MKSLPLELGQVLRQRVAPIVAGEGPVRVEAGRALRHKNFGSRPLQSPTALVINSPLALVYVCLVHTFGGRSTGRW